MPPSARPAVTCRGAASFAVAGLVAALLAAAPLHAQVNAAPVDLSRRIPAESLQADVDLLRRAYEAMHPGLHRYNTPAEMTKRWAALRSAMGRDLTIGEAYVELSRFLATIRCGHTYANFFNQRRGVQQALFERRDKVPFEFRWLGRRMVVTASRSADPSLVPGTEILAIDGRPVARILDRLLAVARTDGHNEAKQLAYLSMQGTDRYEAFDVYYPLLFPPRDTTYSLRVRAPGSARAVTRVVPALTYEAREAARAARAAALDTGDGAAWDFRFLDGTTGYLRMPSWALYDSKWDWKAWLDATVDTLVARGATDLVVDLRGNEGGLDAGNPLLERLVADTLRLTGYERKVRYRTAPAELAPYLDTWDRSFLDWGEQAIGPVDGFYRLVRYDDVPGGDVIAPRGTRFTGRLWVIIGATNSSATFQFASVVQRHRLGTLVGQPTGGNRRGINGGAFFFLRLPRSGLEADLPLIGYFPRTAEPDAGVVPDIPVTPTIADIARGRDAELEAVRGAIRAGGVSGDSSAPDRRESLRAPRLRARRFLFCSLARSNTGLWRCP